MAYTSLSDINNSQSPYLSMQVLTSALPDTENRLGIIYIEGFSAVPLSFYYNIHPANGFLKLRHCSCRR